MNKLRVFVTGGNDGIGRALCHQLARDHKYHVLLGSRNAERGQAAIASIMEGAPEGTQVDLVICDVTDDASIQAAAETMKAHAPLYAIVNNAGAGLSVPGVTPDDVVNINAYGPKRVVEAFLPLLQAEGGRIVGTSSGIASGYVSNSSMGSTIGTVPLEERAPLMDPNCTWEQLEAILKKEKEAGYGADPRAAGFCAYGVSKAVLTAYHMILARENPKLIVSTCSPGFIDTKMTSGFGAKLSPAEGTVSLKHCIMDDLGACKGWYYGSDGLRSPLDFMRNPGDPEFQG